MWWQKIPVHDFSFFPKIDGSARINQILNREATPFYVGQKSIVGARSQELTTAFGRIWGPELALAYSFKTNYEVAANIGFEMAETVSEREFLLAKQYGYADSRIIINGPNKGKIDNLLSRPVIVNIDNWTEIEAVRKYPKKIKAKLGIRLKTVAGVSRFGFEIESGEAAAAAVKLGESGLIPSGFHYHAGSDIQNPEIFRKAAEAVVGFLEKNPGFKNIAYLDFGGGIPSHGLIHKSARQAFPDLNLYAEKICRPLLPIFSAKRPTLILEPGRAVADDAVVMLTRVTDSKQGKNQQIIVVDSSNTMLPSVWYRTPLIRGFDRKLKTLAGHNKKTTVYGCSCQESDVIFRGILPEMKAGDVAAVYCTGAYNQSQTGEFIFDKPKTFFI